MSGGSGKYVQDNDTGNNERETQNGGTIERLPGKGPGDERYEDDTGARPDRVCDSTDRVRKARERKKKATA
ncbi:hypothetical protein SAMN05216411_10714 [Nitrosospira multiformis]|nr:hypothetical protein SAMN05216411_10714 [Nitrosospira multiformis]